MASTLEGDACALQFCRVEKSCFSVSLSREHTSHLDLVAFACASQSADVPVLLKRPGRLSGVVLWLDYMLTDEHTLSTSPSAGKGSIPLYRRPVHSFCLLLRRKANK